MGVHQSDALLEDSFCSSLILPCDGDVLFVLHLDGSGGEAGILWGVEGRGAALQRGGDDVVNDMLVAHVGVGVGILVGTEIGDAEIAVGIAGPSPVDVVVAILVVAVEDERVP